MFFLLPTLRNEKNLEIKVAAYMSIGVFKIRRDLFAGPFLKTALAI